MPTIFDSMPTLRWNVFPKLGGRWHCRRGFPRVIDPGLMGDQRDVCRDQVLNYSL
jgi:hypothetical protein